VASAVFERRTLRRFPALRGLPSRELKAVQDRMVYRSYQAGEVIWRSHRPLEFTGYVQNGEVDLENRVDGVLVRTTRLSAGDLLPRMLEDSRPHESVIALAISDVRLGVLPDALPGQSAGEARLLPVALTPRRNWLNWLWPLFLILLVAVLARDDLVRITSGLFYLASDQDPNSMSLLRAAQKVDGDAAFAYNEEGYRWFQQGRLSGAEAAFAQAVDSDPADAAALNNLGIIYFTQGDLLQAERYLYRAMQQNPDTPITRYNLGMTLMRLNDTAGAIREFREADFIDHGSSSLLLQQANLYNQVGDFANAEQRAQTALELNPSLASAHLILGIALYNQGREADALAAFADTLALEPGSQVAAFYQALILGHMKEYDAALPILHGLLTTATDAPETARILAEIDAVYRFKSESAAAGP
jgi:Flp pilus assembly protein TadD